MGEFASSSWAAEGTDSWTPSSTDQASLGTAADPEEGDARVEPKNTTTCATASMADEAGERTPIEVWLESHFTPAQRQLPLLGLELRRLASLQSSPPPPPQPDTSEQPQDDDVDGGGGGGGEVDEAEDDEAQQRQRTTIEDLPVEVLCAVFAAVESPRDVLACSATCRAWATILGALRSPTTSDGSGSDEESDALWKTLVLTNKRWLRHGRASALVPPPRTSWRQYYRMRCHSERNWRVGTMLVKTIPLSSTVRSFDYRPGGTLTSLSHAGIHFYDVVSGASQGKISVPFSPMCHQQFDPFLLVGGTGSKLHLYHDDGRLLAAYPHAELVDGAEEPRTVSSVACNVSLGKFVSATSSTALLWDLTSTQPLWTLPGATKTTALHYDDQKILAGAQGVAVYDAKSGGQVCALQQAEPTKSLACLNSFYTLVSTAHDSFVWDLRMPQSCLPRYFYGHCCAHPELERVVYASDDWLSLSSYETLISTAGGSSKDLLTLWQVRVPGMMGLETKQVRMDQDRIVVGRGQAIHISSFVHAHSTK